MKMQTLFAAFTLGLASQLASAEDSNAYAGVAVGKSPITFNTNDFFSPRPSNARNEGATVGQDTSYKLFVGYHFDKTWAIEGGYTHHGNFQFRSTNVDTRITVFDYSASSWYLAGKGVLPVSERASLFAKLGASANKAKNNYWLDSSHVLALPLAPFTVVSQPTLASNINPGSKSEVVIAPLVGGGLEYTLKKNVKCRLEYENYGKFGGETSTGRTYFTMTSIGVSYDF